MGTRAASQSAAVARAVPAEPRVALQEAPLAALRVAPPAVLQAAHPEVQAGRVGPADREDKDPGFLATDKAFPVLAVRTLTFPTEPSQDRSRAS